MWIKFNLDGMIFELEIKNYMPVQAMNDSWVDVSYCFNFKNAIQCFSNNNEILLNWEVDEIRNYTEKLLNDQLDKTVNLECIEPDLNFIFKPKYDLRNDPNHLCINPGYEIEDIKIEIRVNLWCGVPTANYFSTTMYRDNIELFYLYLSLVTKKISIDDIKVKKLLETGIIYGDI